MYIDQELDLCPGYGWQGGPNFSTRVIALQNGVERRNAQMAQARHSYTLPINNITDPAYLTVLKSTFMVTMGQCHSFKAKDWSDFQATLEPFGIGDGTTKIFQLIKQSTFGSGFYQRNITKPNASPVITVNGASAAHTIDLLTGLVMFTTAPAASAILRWSGEFRVPVRFASDALAITLDNRINKQNYSVNGSVDLIEVFE